MKNHILRFFSGEPEWSTLLGLLDTHPVANPFRIRIAQIIEILDSGVIIDDQAEMLNSLRSIKTIFVSRDWSQLTREMDKLIKKVERS